MQAACLQLVLLSGSPWVDATQVNYDGSVSTHEPDQFSLQPHHRHHHRRRLSTELLLDVKAADKTFDGVGAVSGGGATTRLLVDYPEPQRSQILDYLFKPNFGAALQVLKVEIGGDSQSTNGAESSHMHSEHTIDMTTGYEWWLMKEARKRNPDIMLYGLPWTFPGWVANDPITGKVSKTNTAGDGRKQGSPFTYPEQTSRYVVEWVKGAKERHGLTIDYVGIWNERTAPTEYATTLRAALDDAGLEGTRIVAKDNNVSVCHEMLADPKFAEVVDVIGLHYPSDYIDPDTKKQADYAPCHKLNKPVWSAEESSSYNDLNGASCWARVVHAHYVLSGMTASLMWNLVHSYYHGTDWYGASLLTAVEPWSGHFDLQPVVWATAHVTQFAQPGWRYLARGRGSGELPGGGFYTSIVSTADASSADDEFSLFVVKIDRDMDSCTRPELPDFKVHAEVAYFHLPSHAGVSLACWRSNFAQAKPILFEQQGDLTVGPDGRFSLRVEIGDYYTISTVRTAQRGKHGHGRGSGTAIPPSQPSFPLPYAQNFNRVPTSQEAPYFVNQIGAFEVHVTLDEKERGKNGWRPRPKPPQPQEVDADTDDNAAIGEGEAESEDEGMLESQRRTPPHRRAGGSSSSSSSHRRVLRQMVPQTPIGWSDGGFKGPVTLVGMKEWQDVSVSVDFRLPASHVAACVGTRADQMWVEGIVVCVHPSGAYTVTYGGPEISGNIDPWRWIAKGNAILKPGVTEWHTLNVTTIDTVIAASLDGQSLWPGETAFPTKAIRAADTGFVALGTNAWAPVEFDNFRVAKAGPRWHVATPEGGCTPPAEGRPLTTRPCQTNGLTAPDQDFELTAPSYQIRHRPSDLCVTAAEDHERVVLRKCGFRLPAQRFEHRYFSVRNADVPFVVNVSGTKYGHVLRGQFDGSVTLVAGDGNYHGAVPPNYPNPGWQSWSYFPNTRQLHNYYWVLSGEMGYPRCLSTCSSGGGEQDQASSSADADAHASYEARESVPLPD